MGNGVGALILQARNAARLRQQQQQQFDSSANAPIPGYSGPQQYAAMPTVQPLPQINTLQDAIRYAAGNAAGTAQVPYTPSPIPGLQNPSMSGASQIPYAPSPDAQPGHYGLLAMQLAGLQPGQAPGLDAAMGTPPMSGAPMDITKRFGLLGGK